MMGTTTYSLLAPLDAADTSAATGTGVEVVGFDGVISFTQSVGVVTAGSIAGKIVTSDASNLAGATDLLTFVTVDTDGDPATETVKIDSNSCKKYVGYVGQITTGPAAVSAIVTGKLKYAS